MESIGQVFQLFVSSRASTFDSILILSKLFIDCLELLYIRLFIQLYPSLFQSLVFHRLCKQLHIKINTNDSITTSSLSCFSSRSDILLTKYEINCDKEKIYFAHPHRDLFLTSKEFLTNSFYLHFWSFILPLNISSNTSTALLNIIY
jgi:hypothetical protein